MSMVAVFRKADGALEHVAPAALAPAEDDTTFAATPLPDDYSDETHQWDTEARTFVASLVRLRARRWAAIKARAASAEDAGTMTAQGRVQTDPDSRGKITGMVVMAMLAQSTGQPFEQRFTMADNSSVTVDAAGMIGIGLAAGLHVVACHAAAQAKRAQITSAETAEEIEAIAVDEGWPA
ncbi:MAG TPA: DUF4376 domain-containing protein [Sphingomicrobium sp.]|jgi:hypothetical protein